MMYASRWKLFVLVVPYCYIMGSDKFSLVPTSVTATISTVQQVTNFFNAPLRTKVTLGADYFLGPDTQAYHQVALVNKQRQLVLSSGNTLTAEYLYEPMASGYKIPINISCFLFGTVPLLAALLYGAYNNYRLDKLMPQAASASAFLFLVGIGYNFCSAGDACIATNKAELFQARVRDKIGGIHYSVNHNRQIPDEDRSDDKNNDMPSQSTSLNLIGSDNNFPFMINPLKRSTVVFNNAVRNQDDPVLQACFKFNQDQLNYNAQKRTRAAYGLMAGAIAGATLAYWLQHYGPIPKLAHGNIPLPVNKSVMDLFKHYKPQGVS